MRIRNTAALIGLVALAGVAAGPAEITLTEAVRTAEGVDIAGTVELGEAGRQCTLAEGRGKITPLANADVADALGLDLADACVERTETGLRFVWVMGSPLPAQVPPEGVRYTWSFRAGEQTLQLQAKRTNVASATTAEDPVGHLQQLQRGDVGWFQVRGACTTAYLGTPISGCYHLDFVDGGFDVEAGQVWIDLPFDPRDDRGRPYAPDFLDGAAIDEAASAGMSIGAAAQAVASSTDTAAFLNGWGQYCTAETALAGLGADWGTDDLQPLALADDGSFAATLVGDGSHAHVEACSGFRSAWASAAVS